MCLPGLIHRWPGGDPAVWRPLRDTDRSAPATRMIFQVDTSRWSRPVRPARITEDKRLLYGRRLGGGAIDGPCWIAWPALLARRRKNPRSEAAASPSPPWACSIVGRVWASRRLAMRSVAPGGPVPGWLAPQRHQDGHRAGSAVTNRGRMSGSRTRGCAWREVAAGKRGSCGGTQCAQPDPSC